MILLALLLLAVPAFAGEVIVPPPTFTPGKWPPVVVTDPVPGATHCALLGDGVQYGDVKVMPDSSCRIDVSWLPAGPRRVQVVAVRTDGASREQTAPVPLFDESCALVVKPSTSGFRVGWHHVVTCTKSSGCKTLCP